MRDRNAPLTGADIDALAWDKMDGLLPAAVQDQRSGRLLMLGYVNKEALASTLESGFVTFYSRSKQCPIVGGRSQTAGETQDDDRLCFLHVLSPLVRIRALVASQE